MSFTDLFESGEHSRNLGHFASLANIAFNDGALAKKEEELLKRFAIKLDIRDGEYDAVLKNTANYPINPPIDKDSRLERIHDLFEMIFANHDIDEEERKLIVKYAIGLGYTSDLAEKLINRSIAIYEGKFDLEDYRYLLNRKK